jgi:hypothetical protein
MPVIFTSLLLPVRSLPQVVRGGGTSIVLVALAVRLQMPVTLLPST